MKKTKVFGTAIAVFLVLIVGEGLEGQESKPPPSKPVNIVVILDTSDRISKEKNPGQAANDIEIAKSIIDSYFKRARLEMFQTYDRLTFVVPAQQEPQISREITRQLTLWPTAADRQCGRPCFEKKKQKLLTAIDGLYQFLEKQKKFTGSDIWYWFYSDAEWFLKQDMRNYIICLSDGYLDFNKSIQKTRPKIGNKTSYIPYAQVVKFRKDPNWEQKFDSERHGLLEIEKDFSSHGAKFLMVEIDVRYMLDLPILKKYWRTWLESMGINQPKFVPLPSDYRSNRAIEEIEAFVSQNQ